MQAFKKKKFQKILSKNSTISTINSEKVPILQKFYAIG